MTLAEKLKDKDDSNGTTIDTQANNDSKALEEAKKKAEDAEARAAEAEFNVAFGSVSSTYPHAKEYRDTIRDKVKNGYSVDDAAVSVLQKEGKLLTQEQIDRQANKGTDLGGSARADVTAEETAKEPNLEEATKAFKDAVDKGEIYIA